MADLARRSLRSKIPELEQALYGKLTEHHGWMLGLLMDQLQRGTEYHDLGHDLLDRTGENN